MQTLSGVRLGKRRSIRLVHHEIFDPIKVAHVASNEREIALKRRGGDQEVHIGDKLTLPTQG